jgi:hypothetical protein
MMLCPPTPGAASYLLLAHLPILHHKPRVLECNESQQSGVANILTGLPLAVFPFDSV